MIGHVAGCFAQFAFTAACKKYFPNQPGCGPAGVMLHEFIVEPTVNTISLYAYKGFASEGQEREAIGYGSFIASAFGSLMAGQAAELFTENIYVSGFAGLVGSYAGDMLYHRVADSFNSTHHSEVF